MSKLNISSKIITFFTETESNCIVLNTRDKYVIEFTVDKLSYEQNAHRDKGKLYSFDFNFKNARISQSTALTIEPLPFSFVNPILNDDQKLVYTFTEDANNNNITKYIYLDLIFVEEGIIDVVRYAVEVRVNEAVCNSTDTMTDDQGTVFSNSNCEALPTCSSSSLYQISSPDFAANNISVAIIEQATGNVIDKAEKSDGNWAKSNGKGIISFQNDKFSIDYNKMPSVGPCFVYYSVDKEYVCDTLTMSIDMIRENDPIFGDCFKLRGLFPITQVNYYSSPDYPITESNTTQTNSVGWAVCPLSIFNYNLPIFVKQTYITASNCKYILTFELNETGNIEVELTPVICDKKKIQTVFNVCLDLVSGHHLDPIAA